jgi:hypothetical protein
MCIQCQQEISNFRNRQSPASPWKHLDRKIVADRLQEILCDPNTLQQGAIGFCGVAAFLRVWVQYDHLAVARFAIQLFDTGQGIIGQDVIKASTDLLDCDYPNIQWVNDQGQALLPCPQADWLMMSTIQDDSNLMLDFTGVPGEKMAEGWWPWNVVDYLKRTQLFLNVNNEIPLIPSNIGFLKVGADQATYLYPTQTIDYILMINAQLLAPVLKDKGLWGFYTNNTPNHFIGLDSAPIKVTENGADFIQMRYFSWGELEDGKFAYQDFDDNYYGDIAVGAKSPKIPLPVVSDLPSQPSALTAQLSNGILTLEWLSTSLLDGHYSIECAKSDDPNVVFKEITRVSPRKPSTLGAAHHEDVSGSSGVRWYRIRTFNRVGSSGYSDIVMVDLPNGPVRTIHPYDDDISTPPPYVAQVTILRAEPGLIPLGFARFAPNPCDCLQPEVVYDAKWVPSALNFRTMQIQANKLFKPNRDAYIFIRFENSSIGYEMGIPMKEDASLVLTLLYSSGSGQNHPVMVPLKRCVKDGRTCYWGVHTPVSGQTPYLIKLHIQGLDAYDHYGPRTLYQYFQGGVLDRNPATEARADSSNPPLYPFLSYLPGKDISHQFRVGTISQSLPADTLEANDTFATATPVLLSSAGGLVKAFTSLALSTASDKDVFQITYLTTPEDDACRLVGAYKEWLSQLMGLYIMHYPPLLEAVLFLEPRECVDLALYKSDASTRTHNLPKQSQVSLYNPSLAYFPDHTLYLVVKNSDFARQGALPYKIRFSYAHAHDEAHVDSNAPAYKPRTSVGRILLQQVYDKLDLPRPSEDWRVHYEQNMRTVVEQTAAILLNPETAAQLSSALERDVRQALAQDCRLAGKAAAKLGMSELAKKLNRASSRYL